MGLNLVIFLKGEGLFNYILRVGKLIILNFTLVCLRKSFVKQTQGGIKFEYCNGWKREIGLEWEANLKLLVWGNTCLAQSLEHATQSQGHEFKPRTVCGTYLK